jgi:hypothetical protein
MTGSSSVTCKVKPALVAPLAIARIQEFDSLQRALIFLEFLWRFGVTLLAILLPILCACALFRGGAHQLALAYPSSAAGLEHGVLALNCLLLTSGASFCLARAFFWTLSGQFGPYELRFISHGGTDLYRGQSLKPTAP